MHKDQNHDDLVDLGIASEETRGGTRQGSEPGGKNFLMSGISDND